MLKGVARWIVCGRAGWRGAARRGVAWRGVAWRGVGPHVVRLLATVAENDAESYASFYWAHITCLLVSSRPWASGRARREQSASHPMRQSQKQTHNSAKFHGTTFENIFILKPS